MNKARFEAFSDSVFAFAITLLVLGIVLPEMRDPSDRDLTLALLHLWPNVVAYVLSFAVIAIMWQNHHALFRMIERVDRRTVFLNLLLLGSTVFIPFATSTLGVHPTMHASTFLYGLVLTAAATSFNGMLMHLVSSGAFGSDVREDTIRQTIIAYRIAWATYATATLLALVYPLVAFGAYLAIVGYFLVPRGVDADI